MFPLKFTQNFFINQTKIPKIVENLLADLPTIEIGAGLGAFTKYLPNGSIVIEKDEKLSDELKVNFPNLDVLNIDFFDFELLKVNFQVFSNLPFAFTSEILVKLMKNKYFQFGIFIIQKESAEMFLGIDRNNLKSVVYQNYFNLEITQKLARSDFGPKPSVDTVVLEITRKNIDQVVCCKNLDIIEFEKLVREMGNVRIGEGKFWKDFDKKKLKSLCSDLGIEHGKGLFGNSREKIYELIACKLN